MGDSENYAALTGRVREKKPLIHHITNYVTVNDCANITLAIGASPIMADAIGEAADIAAMANALVLNMGTLNERVIPSMLAAGKSANRQGAPVVFDPVGAGASKLRNETVETLLGEIRMSVIRGNISEMRFVAGLRADTRGVDASSKDTLETDALETAKIVAARFQCVAAVTGKTDIVTDGARSVFIENGHSMLSGLTGTGCMCASLIGSFCGVSDSAFDATVAALLVMGIAGEIAFERAGQKGNGSFRAALHDAVSMMDGKTLAERAKIHEG
ncbi:MAG: hydroxyethylthiazole kinase [Treponema sp.]|jgi:hydroxyethylthiazole kinase|nr:hydroxyethylthiazole kinase [Treponema sp.]